jgi:PBP1b-binding outer membrane lipoprotein LpoB
MNNANPICKHIAKAPQANASTKALSKSLQSQPKYRLSGRFRIAHAQKNKINLCFVDRSVQFDNDKKIKLNK